MFSFGVNLSFGVSIFLSLVPGAIYNVVTKALERPEDRLPKVTPSTQSSGIFRCDRCSYSTHVKYRMQRHQRIHSGDYIKCDLCSAKFTEPCELRSHHQSMHEGIGVECPVCRKVLRSKHSLATHRAQQHPKKTFTCHLCVHSRPFVKLGNLQHHMLTFHGSVQPLSQ